MAAFGKWLKHRRLALGLSQKELAERIGYSAALVRKIEAGERRASQEITELLVAPLQISEAERTAFIQFARAGAPSGETLPFLLSASTTEANERLVAPQPLSPLTERESDILRLMTQELPDPVIAERMSLTLGTVRWYVKQIYSKLGVHSREEAIQRMTAASPLPTPPAGRYNLPIQLSSFIGREQEIVEVNRLLALSRLVTLTGTGGCGKTRLAIQVIAEMWVDDDNEVWFVELASLTDPTLVPQTVAGGMGLRAAPGVPPLKVLLDYLRPRRTLLALDNCEHLVTVCAQLAETLLQVCPSLKLLATSREALGLVGEITFPVPPLALPNPGHLPAIESLVQVEAVRLFVERAQAVAPAFNLTDDNAPAVAEVCRRLDGIPLAIELAAARVKVLRVEQIADRLNDRFQLLTGGSRTALPRQQTLQALIDWSYDLLSKPEQALLNRLSVFSGGWNLPAAEAVCASDGPERILPDQVLDLLTQLVNKSLVIVERRQGAEIRYHFLETIRHYASNQLWVAGQVEQFRDQHLAYFLNLAQQAEQALIGPNQIAWHKRLDEELDNIRAALEWSLERNVLDGLRLAAALMGYWEHHSPIAEGIGWLSQLLRQPADSTGAATRARALAVLSYLTADQGDFIEAQARAEDALVLYRELANQSGIAFTLLTMGRVFDRMEEYDAAYTFAAESLALYRMLGDKLGIAEALGTVGWIIHGKDYGRGRASLEESLLLFRELGHVTGIWRQLKRLGMLALWHQEYALAHIWLAELLEIQRSLGPAARAWGAAAQGALAMREGDYELARSHFEESVTLFRQSGMTPWLIMVRTNLAYVALRQGDETQARTLFVECQKEFSERGIKVGVVYALEGLASLAVAQGQAERALRLFAWADASRESLEDIRPPVEQANVARDLAAISVQLNEATIAVAYEAGRLMTMEQAVALALEE